MRAEARPRLFAVEEDFASDLSEAMERAGRMLSRRARSAYEMRTGLTAAGFSDAVMEQTLARLEELGFVDDAAFCAQWIEERAERKGLGPKALSAELEARGIDRETIREALAAAELDELAVATKEAARRVGRLSRLPVREQGARLMAFLLRRGFSGEVAEAAARAVLPPEGWD